MGKPSPRPISIHEYWDDRDSAATLAELTPGEDFILRRELTLREAFIAFSARAMGLAMEHDARVESVEEFRGLFAVTVHFVAEDGELAHKLRPIVNHEGIICKPRKPHIEKGYFLKKRDDLDAEFEALLSGHPIRDPAGV